LERAVNDNPILQIGRYRILSELGHGAMGVVYGAEDPLLSRKVAIKTILMSADARERAEYEPRFYQEAKAAGSLNHPNIITIYDIGREGDIAYMAMELLEGVELKNLMINARLTLPRSLSIAAQVADGLAFAHERGVVHRDVKPSNIMIVRGEHAKIMDFGIARMKISDVKTQTGMLLGSPKYMSPEQIVGRPFDHRSDIFSLGVMLYEMATGVPPFSGGDMAMLINAISNTTPHAPSRVQEGVPPMLELIIAKALAKKPADRYQDAREMAADLRACGDLLASAAPQPDPAATGTQPPAALDLLLSDSAPVRTLPMAPPADTRPSPDATTDARIAMVPAADSGLDTSAASPRYAISRKFDASATLLKLSSFDPAGHDAAQTPVGARRRWSMSRDHRLLAIAIALAVAAAVAIALG
jgi:serine/threonine protein kinase